jgi:ABC-type amino acid transport substrate-binding protein
VGLGAGAAQASLESQGLAVQTRIESSPDVPEGDVIRQDPSAGSEVLSGATVQLVVSDGPAPVLIPETAAILRDTAVSRLEREGLRVSVTLVASGVVNVDRVIRTEPAAGTSVQFGSSVELLVSSGPASACSTLFPNNFASIGFDGSLSVGSDGLPTGFEPAIFQAVIEQMCGTTVQSEFSILESAERFEAVQTGRVDILPTSQISRFFGLLYTTPYVLLNGENPPAFAIRGGLNLERGQVNAALLELIESGRWRELHLEWLGEPSYTVNQMLETPLLEE